MTANQIKASIYAEYERVAAELKEKMEKEGKTDYEVMLDNPFLAGQIHVLNNITRAAMMAK